MKLGVQLKWGNFNKEGQIKIRGSFFKKGVGKEVLQ
jgi:hypothetical protein